MGRRLKIIESSREIALVSSRRGRTFLALLAVEAVIFVVYFSSLATVAGSAWDVMLPLGACLAVMVWTASHIAADARLSLDLSQRSARLVRTSAITGRSTSMSFPLDQVAGMALRQVGGRRVSSLEPREYSVAVALHDGSRHEFRIHGAFIACRTTLDRFCSSAGLGNVARLQS